MSALLRLSWSIARMGWRATWNRSIRFSKMKTGLIALALQLLFFALIARRAPMLAGAATRDGMLGLLTLMSVQMAWFGLIYGFSRGQQQLYQGILVPLFQMTPARPLGFLVGRVIEAVPLRFFSIGLWAWVYARALPGEERWLAALLLAAVGMAVGMIAHLSGLLLLSFWSRYSPGTMRNGNTFFGIITLALLTAAMIYLSQGGSLTELALTMRQYRIGVFTAVVMAAGIPGLGLLAALFIRPDAVEHLYRTGLYQVLELNDTDISRPGRSQWLPIPEPVFRAVLSREWLELLRARMVRIQALVWVAGTVGTFFAGRSMIDQPLSRVIPLVAFNALLAWFLSYGHWVVRAFEKERRTIHLYRLAAISGSRLVAAKFLSVFLPSALLVSISTLVGGAAAELDLTGALTLLAWALGALAAGVFGGFGMTAATADQNPEETELDTTPRREGAPEPGGGGQWWALARTIALMLCAGLPIWAAAGQPWLPWTLPWLPLLVLLAIMPTMLLAAGFWIMSRSWDGA